jgi:hypothetical protein
MRGLADLEKANELRMDDLRRGDHAKFLADHALVTSALLEICIEPINRLLPRGARKLPAFPYAPC